jgi:hypothetical protein
MYTNIMSASTHRGILTCNISVDCFPSSGLHCTTAFLLSKIVSFPVILYLSFLVALLILSSNLNVLILRVYDIT